MATLYWISTSSTAFGTAANWSTGSAPTTGDDVVIQAIPGSSLANIAASDQSSITLASLTIHQSYTGTIGDAGAGSTTYLRISSTLFTIGVPPTDGSNSASGSGRIKIDFGSNQMTGTILNTSQSSSDTNSPPVQIKGTHASNKLYVLSGKAGVATATPGETSTLTELDVVGNQAQVTLGSGVTMTTVYVGGGGKVTTNGAVTTLNVSNGSQATCYGTGKVTTISNNGTVYANQRPAAGNACDTLNSYNGSTTDFSGNPAAATVGTHNVYPGSTTKVNGANPSHLTVTTRSLVSGVGTISYAF